MSFKKLTGSLGKAVACDSKNKVITGFLTGVKTGVGFKKRSCVYHLTTAKGEQIDVWGGAAIDRCLREGDKVVPAIQNRLVQFKFNGVVKLSGKKTFNDIEVSVDVTKKLPKKRENLLF